MTYPNFSAIDSNSPTTFCSRCGKPAEYNVTLTEHSKTKMCSMCAKKVQDDSNAVIKKEADALAEREKEEAKTKEIETKKTGLADLGKKV